METRPAQQPKCSVLICSSPTNTPYNSLVLAFIKLKAPNFLHLKEVENEELIVKSDQRAPIFFFQENPSTNYSPRISWIIKSSKHHHAFLISHLYAFTLLPFHPLTLSLPKVFNICHKVGSRQLLHTQLTASVYTFSSPGVIAPGYHPSP